jgi:hypothetical protein
MVSQVVSPTLTSGMKHASLAEDSASSSSSSPSVVTQAQHPKTSSRTYDAFWRDHGSTQGNIAAKYLRAQTPKVTPTPSLLPAPQFYSSVPKLPSNTSNSSFLSSNSTVPQTPPQRPSNRRPRTSSERYSMEQDAVETLVLMSSPGTGKPRTSYTSAPRHRKTMSSSTFATEEQESFVEKNKRLDQVLDAMLEQDSISDNASQASEDTDRRASTIFSPISPERNQNGSITRVM